MKFGRSLAAVTGWAALAVGCGAYADRAPATSPAPSAVPPAWQVVAVDIAETIASVRVGPAAGDLWLMTPGAIHHRRGDGTWTAPLAAPGEGLVSMWVAPSGIVYAASLESEVMAWRDGGWASVGRLGNCVSLHVRIEGRDPSVVATCPYYSGFATWRADEPSTFRERRDLAPDDVAVVGPGEVLVLQNDALAFIRLGEPDAVSTLRKGAFGQRVLWADRRRIVVVAEGGEMHHASWDAASGAIAGWRVHRLPTPGVIEDLWASDGGEIFAVGQRGAIYRFDGSSWAAVVSPTTSDLRTIDGGASGVWVGGDGGTLLHLPPGTAPAARPG